MPYQDTLARRRLVFDLYAELHEDVPETDDVLPVTPALLTYIARATREAGMGVRREQIKVWLDNPARFSPHIDEVAVRRAIEFDWPVIDALTLDELEEATRRLKRRSDPWGVLIQSDLAPHTRDGEAVVEVDVPRRDAFQNGTLTQRTRVQRYYQRLPLAA